LPRRPAHDDRRGHQRDPAPGHRARAPEALGNLTRIAARLLIVALAVIALRRILWPAAGPGAPAPEPLALPAGTRAVVIAPHPDDEVLAAAGLIARLAADGDAVSVVFVTSGDGYHEAAGIAPETCPQDAWTLRQLAAVRQEEARTAARRLG